MARLRRRAFGRVAEVAVRCCDIGGWLDTWFAHVGEILNLGVFSRPFGSKNADFRGIEVIVSQPKKDFPAGRICIRDANPIFDINAEIEDLMTGNFDTQNLSLSTLSLVPRELLEPCLQARILSPYPSGASLGTSGSVEVALLYAVMNGSVSDAELAKMAWKAEYEVAKRQTGVQDHCAAAYSQNVHRISVTGFPETSVRVVPISDKVRTSLEEGLITIVYGRHDSGFTHETVIKQLNEEGEHSPLLRPFRGLAERAENYLLQEKMVEFGNVMDQNTEAQRELCPGLVSGKASAIIACAKSAYALGCKVNGAGGDGGSITALFPSRETATHFHSVCEDLASELNLTFFEHRLAGSYEGSE